MENRFLLLVCLLVANLLNGCQEPYEETCPLPTSLTVKSPCESDYPGSLLIPPDQYTAARKQLSYMVYPQPDTLSSDRLSNKKAWGNFSIGQLFVPDSILANSPKFVVSVSIICDGVSKKSPYFSFVKQPAGEPGCYRWVLQRQ